MEASRESQTLVKVKTMIFLNILVMRLEEQVEKLAVMKSLC